MRTALRVVQVRLRIPAILLISAIVVGRWDMIRNHYDKLTRPGLDPSIAAQAVSSDTEYFCPMDPGVISDWPGKCGICNMALVRRKRGEAAALPDGVVARMQISPYRIQLAGIRTAPLTYQPLMRACETAGIVHRSGTEVFVPVEIPARSAPWISDGQAAEVRSEVRPGREPMAGRLRIKDRVKEPGGDRLTASVTIADAPSWLESGMIVDLTFKVPVSQLEPFRSMPTDPGPLKPGELRRVFACSDHPDSPAVQPGHCPVDGNGLEARSLAGHQRVRWWCPMHPTVTADHAGETCKECSGRLLRPRVVSFRPAGKVLAVPELAVVDTGLKVIVFVESMPGTFDGIEVVLGPRCGDFYPVVRGVEAGQNVVLAGAFLLDAETRLNPSLAASYFGAAGRETSSSGTRSGAIPAPQEARSPLEALSPRDHALAERQKVCPVTKKALGSMGTPARVVISGRVVFLCCGGCEDTLKSEPAKYLAELPALPSP
jgi:hypothetical protein